MPRDSTSPRDIWYYFTVEHTSPMGFLCTLVQATTDFCRHNYSRQGVKRCDPSLTDAPTVGFYQCRLFPSWEWLCYTSTKHTFPGVAASTLEALCRYSILVFRHQQRTPSVDIASERRVAFSCTSSSFPSQSSLQVSLHLIN